MQSCGVRDAYISFFTIIRHEAINECNSEPLERLQRHSSYLLEVVWFVRASVIPPFYPLY